MTSASMSNTGCGRPASGCRSKRHDGDLAIRGRRTDAAAVLEVQAGSGNQIDDRSGDEHLPVTRLGKITLIADLTIGGPGSIADVTPCASGSPDYSLIADAHCTARPGLEERRQPLQQRVPRSLDPRA